jgi:hypothetical protein
MLILIITNELHIDCNSLLVLFQIRGRSVVLGYKKVVG